ncbi:M23 family metallopeptidase [Agrobacterium vitis]|uniref:Peptidoglycan DD-metalloendopeptidase family protein n=1 Tax=Agrobacterium vitis TaxID=373 RepID=A0AAE4WBZ4_AGRVI|nr:M23 family metallopeptidase [Agrobacterium vitis]MCF1497977.1 M23 family metallopeptidase [Allorhizobium sp. Av2]MCM2440098.1 M23 family metallopeptidase [Agrobacterium vitis]MUZ57896.1 peptidoglycan DD-metalloendopeptidase family protein [Agrobacterium vitis]MVA67441.1 peptidoglycan DD-metalloendopeptidase family protein [Agrobacterium vitis]MVA86776.1 peptidoglycan DD-metalloendopeptidase family protein [Agrobacterium vitis]
MSLDKNLLRSLGMEPPILADGRRAPDRREISLRWLTGTFLTGITSSVLMGVALFAALDGRQQLAIPAEAFALADLKQHNDSADGVRRGGRLINTVISAKTASRSVLDVSTVIRSGDKDVVRRQPFTHLKMLVSTSLSTQENYPPFDPLSIFAGDEQTVTPRTGTIYGSNVDSEISLKTVAFPVNGTPFKAAPGMTSDEVEENVRSNGSVLTEGTQQVSGLYYIDPERFADPDADLDINPGLSARVVEQNLSVSTPDPVTPDTDEYADDIIPVRREQTIIAALTGAGYPEAKARAISDSLSEKLGSPSLQSGDVLRLGIIQRGEQARVVRFSAYRGGKHLVTMAVDDQSHLVEGSEPPMLDAIATAFDENSPPVMASRDLPSIYDGIYRSSLSYGLSKELTGQMVRLLASSVDLQAPLRPTDGLEVFYSAADESGKAAADSELLFLRARFGDTTTSLYRFQDPSDNSVDYFDENGKTNRQFLIRNPVPNGVFRSGFGMRRHPILGYSRMHTGVDWGAPSGSPIIAAGSGTVEKAGWDSGGYGNQTIIRHPNGYESSYNHQSAIAKGVVAGAKIRQGQVIGWVGTTGESTGPHLHYEIIVNGTKVDPMKVRLPDGKSLNGGTLAKFEQERQRIDDLLSSAEKNRQLAANN